MVVINFVVVIVDQPEIREFAREGKILCIRYFFGLRGRAFSFIKQFFSIIFSVLSCRIDQW